MAKYKFDLTPENIRRIENILPKLKYSSYIGNVGKWLQNFDENEIDHAIDFLMFFEYITMNELQQRLSEQLDILNDKVSATDKILLIPFTKYPKSNEIIAYLLSKINVFRAMESQGRIEINRNFESHEYNKNTVLVFIDDFIGTGDSFFKIYNDKKIKDIIENNPLIRENIFLLAAIVMNKGFDMLKVSVPHLTILAELRYNNFCDKNSPFIISRGPQIMKQLAVKYGERIAVQRRGKEKIFRPLGYGDCEALVSFDYGPPNNTLPIIWGSDDWYPIFPRITNDKINKAKELKKNIAFYIGIMKMLRINLYENQSLGILDKYEYDARLDHSLITVIVLLSKKYNEILICQIIGLTIKELSEIYEYGRKRKLLDSKNELTLIGSNLVITLTKSARTQIFRSKKKENFEINTLPYIPKTFKNTA